MAGNELMSMGEVAEALNMTREGVRVAVLRGELAFCLTRGGKVFKRAVVERYAKERPERRLVKRTVATATA